MKASGTMPSRENPATRPTPTWERTARAREVTIAEITIIHAQARPVAICRM